MDLQCRWCRGWVHHQERNDHEALCLEWRRADQYARLTEAARRLDARQVAFVTPQRRRVLH